MIDQDLKSRHLAKFATKPCPIGYIALQYKNLMTEAKIHFIDYMGVHYSDQNLHVRELPKSLIDRLSTWYVNLKPESIHN